MYRPHHGMKVRISMIEHQKRLIDLLRLVYAAVLKLHPPRLGKLVELIAADALKLGNARLILQKFIEELYYTLPPRRRGVYNRYMSWGRFSHGDIMAARSFLPSPSCRYREDPNRSL